MLTREHLALLARADSPTVANVIERFGVRSQVAGYANPTLKALYPELPPAVGYAVTATFRAGYPSEAGASYGDMPGMIEHAHPGGTRGPGPYLAVFQDLDEPTRAATYGEVMATTFQAFGFVGLVTSGAGRDVEQVRRLQLPCWASSVVVSHGYPRISDIGVPVVVGGLRVHTGDLLHADANGIIQIPLDIAAGVAALCVPFMQAEEITLSYLRAPNPTVEGYRQAVGQMHAAMAALRERAQTFLKDGGPR
jgi:4-hydroxy-4-methyl-2-oxoglutarate aldolase